MKIYIFASEKMYIRHVRINQHHEMHAWCMRNKMPHLWSCSAKKPLQSKISSADMVYGVDTGLIRQNDAFNELHDIGKCRRYVLVYYKLAVVNAGEHLVEMKPGESLTLALKKPHP